MDAACILANTDADLIAFSYGDVDGIDCSNINVTDDKPFVMEPGMYVVGLNHDFGIATNVDPVWCNTNTGCILEAVCMMQQNPNTVLNAAFVPLAGGLCNYDRVSQ